ncbi:MAG: plasmid recombination protein [Bacilli bacterium]|nr:plasmid recombination protein [Bacilli bacterium]
MELSYSCHLGNDGNKTKKARRAAKNSLSGTTSYANNAIQNLNQLGHALKHDLRLEEYNNENIVMIIGESQDKETATNHVKSIYQNEFEEARIEYNNKQTRDDRKIDNYLLHVSENTQRDIACEFIIELGNQVYWKAQSFEDKLKMVDVYKQQIKDLEELVPEFKIAVAVVHLDEKSPHMHIIGVPIKDGFKNGMKKQVAKTQVFTKERLVEIQDTMREKCIKEFNETYQVNFTLVDKKVGRNEDIPVAKMKNYDYIKRNLKQNENRISELVDKSYELSNDSNRIKNTLFNITMKPTFDDKYEITNEQIKELMTYNKKVMDTTKNMQKTNGLITTMDDYNAVIETLFFIVSNVKTLTGPSTNLEKNLEEAMKAIAGAVESWTTLILFLTNMVLIKDDPFFTELVDRLVDKQILSLKEYNHIKHGTPLKDKNYIERNDRNERL